MCWLWSGGRLLECNLKNYNLPKILYVVIRTKKWGRSYGHKIKDYIKKRI